MASSTGSNIGIKYGWEVGDNFKAEMDSNLLTLDRILHLSVKDRDLATPPGSPVAGDRYIVAASPTGAWVGQAGMVAVYSGTGWTFYTPKTGWIAFIEDEIKLVAYYAGAWSAGISI